MAKIIATGLGVMPGVVSGTARWADHRGKNVSEGDILIASMTDAEMIAGIHRAEGVLTETGGRTSHAAVVSLANGKVTIVGAGTLKGKINDGDLIALNGSTGEVTLLA